MPADAESRRSRFLAACASEDVDCVPVWFMRQAGRSLPEYRTLRGEGSLLEAVRSPDLAAEITLQPVRRLGVDAAILFSDIVVPLVGIGLEVDIVPGRGPVIADRITSDSDLRRLRPLEPEVDVPYVLETVKILASELTVPLIGFAGAPFTVASYLVEGGATRDFVRTKSLMYSDSGTFAELLERLADLAATFLRAQVEAGASAIQLFDSWAGALSRSDYERHVLPATERLLGQLADLGVPRIHFGVGTGELLDLMGTAGAEVVGVDWRVPLDVARQRVGAGRAVQGNLDPAACLAGYEAAAAETRRILVEGGGRGHVFNLGHGVLPATDPELLGRLVELVHETPAAELAAPEPEAPPDTFPLAGGRR